MLTLSDLFSWAKIGEVLALGLRKGWKIFVAFLLFLCIASVQAQTKIFWDPLPATNQITSYNVYRAPTVGGTYSVIAKVTNSLSSPSYTITLPPGVYFFQVTAQNIIGEGPGGKVATAPLVSPVATPTLTGSNPNGTNLVLSFTWAANPAVEQVSGYILYRRTPGMGTNFAAVASTPINSVSDTVAKGAADYYVAAVNMWGEGPIGGIYSLPPVPGPVTGLRIVQVTGAGLSASPGLSRASPGQPTTTQETAVDQLRTIMDALGPVIQQRKDSPK